MKENRVRSASFAFALRIVALCRRLIEDQREFVLGRQLTSSGTAIGALVREAEYAESKADFVHKMAVALKEANETEYWIELLYHAGYLDEATFHSLHADANELLRILTAIVIEP